MLFDSNTICFDINPVVSHTSFCIVFEANKLAKMAPNKITIPIK